MAHVKWLGAAIFLSPEEPDPGLSTSQGRCSIRVVGSSGAAMRYRLELSGHDGASRFSWQWQRAFLESRSHSVNPGNHIRRWGGGKGDKGHNMGATPWLGSDLVSPAQ